MYVSYDFYKHTFGGTISEEDFSALEREAEVYIRYFTYLNGDIFATESDHVKCAVCSAVDTIFSMRNRAGGAPALKSESNDGYSVTYVTEGTDGQTAEEFIRKKVYEAIRLYLLPTGWLSRRVKIGGCDDGSDGCNGL